MDLASLTIAQLIDYASRLTVLAGLLIIIYVGAKQNPWWVFGWRYRELREELGAMRVERDAWQKVALENIDVNKQTSSATLVVLETVTALVSSIEEDRRITQDSLASLGLLAKSKTPGKRGSKAQQQ